MFLNKCGPSIARTKIFKKSFAPQLGCTNKSIQCLFWHSSEYKRSNKLPASNWAVVQRVYTGTRGLTAGERRAKQNPIKADEFIFVLSVCLSAPRAIVTSSHSRSQPISTGIPCVFSNVDSRERESENGYRMRIVRIKLKLGLFSSTRESWYCLRTEGSDDLGVHEYETHGR